MKVYHYTSAERYAEIRLKGLWPYLNPRKADLIIKPAIWTFKNRLEDESLAGTILYHCVHKLTTKVVELEIDIPSHYEIDGTWLSNGLKDDKVSITHTGKLELTKCDVIYNNEKSFLIRRKITPRRIKLLKDYTVNEAITYLSDVYPEYT